MATSRGRLAAQTSTTGNRIYTAWPNNDTGAWSVFVAKSSDDGKTASKTILLSTPNKEYVLNQNTSCENKCLSMRSKYELLRRQTRAGFWNNYLEQETMGEIHFAQNGQAE
jgi:hypothetical protein